MNVSKPLSYVSMILLVLPTIMMGIHLTGIHLVQATGSASDPSIGPNPPLYFSNENGYPQWTSVGLQLTPLVAGAFGGAAWDALSYGGQLVGASLNGTYTKGPIGVADGFTIMLFAQNGTGPLGYFNNSIPGVSNPSSTGSPYCGGNPPLYSSTGTDGSLGLPLSTTPYVALQWDPFYGSGSEFNLWVMNPATPTNPCSTTANGNPGGIGCGIGVPQANDAISFVVNYTNANNANALGARVVDLSTGVNCSFTLGLSQYGFSPPNFGKYWVFAEGDNGAVYSDWTLLQASVFPLDFAISSPSPNSLTMVQGSTSPSSLITATSLVASVPTLTFSIASALPSGVGATFANNPCTPTCTVTLSFLASATAAVGTSTVVISATDGAATETTTLLLTVSNFFAISSPSPGSLTVLQGSTSPSTSIKATLAPGAATTSVTFSIASTLPSGVTAAFTNDPCSPSCTVTLAFTATSSATQGTTIVTIATTGSGPSETTTLSLTVASFFTLSSPSPGSLIVLQGSNSPSSSITATLTPGFSTQPVAFSVTSSLPSGVTATFTNSHCVPTCTDTVSFSATSTATLGTTSVNITASSSSSIQTVALSLLVAAPFGFTLSAPSPNSLIAPQGAASSDSFITVDLNTGALTQPVTLSVTSSLPAGVAATFTNNPCSPTCTVAVSFSASSGAGLGTFPVTISGSGGGVTQTTNLSLNVSSFTVASPSPNSLTVLQGSTSPSSSITATLAPGGSPHGVTFSVSSPLPTGVTAIFSNPNPCVATCTVILSFRATTTAGIGTVPVTISASGGQVTETTALSLTVSFFSLSNVSPNSVVVAQGSTSPSASITATLALGASSNPVAFAVTSPLPSGVTPVFTNSPCIPTCTVTLSFITTSSAALGTTRVTISASGSGATQTQTIMLTITFDFSLQASSDIIEAQGANNFNTITVSLLPPSTSSGPVTLSLGGLPTGAVACFNGGNCSPTATFTVSPTASVRLLIGSSNPSTPTGTYTITVSGLNSDGILRTTTFHLIVAPGTTPGGATGGGGVPKRL